jgi:hypothetical protein
MPYFPRLPLTLGALAALTALAACDTGPARPDRVDLDRSLLRVAMTDGSTCLGPAPGGGGVEAWSGRLQDCPWPYAYTVEIDPRSNPVRYVLEEVLGAVGADDLLSPIATVTITGPEGRQTVFATPERAGAD